MCLINMTVMSVRAGWNLSCAATAEECHMPEGRDKPCLPQRKQTLQTLTTDLRVCNDRRSRLGVLERSLPRGLQARTHWRCTGGAPSGVFSLRVSGSAELSALYQNSLRSRAVDLGAPALDFASAFGWKTNSECDTQLMQSGRIVCIGWRGRRGEERKQHFNGHSSVSVRWRRWAAFQLSRCCFEAKCLLTPSHRNNMIV